MFKIASFVLLSSSLMIASGQDSTHVSSAIPHDKLLYVIEISSHGSTFPKTNVAGLEDPKTFPSIKGTLTEFGKRQMFLKGRETQKRFALDTTFMSP